MLVRWSNLPAQLSTWEDEDALRQEFPRAPAWGEAVSQGGEDVTDSATTPATQKTEDSDGGVEPDEAGAVRPERARRVARPNKKYSGPE